MNQNAASRAAPKLYHALIRTHHIRSRKKINALKDAAKANECAVLIKSDGAPPGVMYVEAASEDQVTSWVGVVRQLHYLNYELLAPTAPRPVGGRGSFTPSSVEEVESLKEFARRMEKVDLLEWWREAMGFSGHH